MIPMKPANPLFNWKFTAAILLASILFAIGNIAGAAVPVFEAEKTTWHGFDRYDFIMDDQTLEITPFKALPGEGDGIKDPPSGKHRCIIVVPKEFAPGNPWSWQGCYWNHMPQTEIGLLKRGLCIAYISANATLRPGKEWDAWYAYLMRQGLSPKPAFVGMSRGGEFSYTWATSHPDKVSCIYGDNPYIPTPLILKIGVLATNDVPLFHVCGSLDPLLGNCSTEAENIYQQLGGRISVMIKEGAAHHPHSLRDPTPMVDFIVQSVQATNVTPPAFAGTKFVKTCFYSTENSYRNFTNEGVYITTRGAAFVPCYNRYQFGLSNYSGGGITVIMPNNPAPGSPWVFRTDYIGRDAMVDLALLAKGFYIVTGPVAYDDGPVPAQLDAAYKYLVGFGFSKKPVLEGDGAAAGEMYAWAIRNTDNVSCIYGENPIMHSNLSKLPLLDNLNLLAAAGVPLICVSGSRDPSFQDNTLAIKERYQKLGGKIQVITNADGGHYPLAPQDPEPVVDFIIKTVQ